MKKQFELGGISIYADTLHVYTDSAYIVPEDKKHASHKKHKTHSAKNSGRKVMPYRCKECKKYTSTTNAEVLGKQVCGKCRLKENAKESQRTINSFIPLAK